MASTADMIRSGSQAQASGAQLDSDSISGGSTTPSSGVRVVGEDEIYRSENSTTEDLLPGENAPTDSEKRTDSKVSPLEAKSGTKSQTPGNKEVITITDDKGKRKVEIDWENKDQLKKYVQMAHGARKWQAERDQAKQQVEAERSKSKELESNFEVMNRVWQERGIEGLTDLLEGRPGAYKDMVKREFDKQKFLESASPEELQAFKQREDSQKTAKELDKIRKENEEFKKQITEKEERAELASLESRVHPSFDKHRFAGKLGDANDEHMFDEMLWTTALKRLEPYEAEGHEITPELVEREFRAVAGSLRKRIGLQAEKKASRVVEQKKQEATENVQAKLMSGYKQGGAANEARKMINDGNITGLLKGWGKYGSLFNGGKK